MSMEMLPRGNAGFGFAASLEGGYPFHARLACQPRAQLVYQPVDIDKFNDGVADVRYSKPIRWPAGSAPTRRALPGMLEVSCCPLALFYEPAK